MNEKYFEVNKEHWDELARLHFETESEEFSAHLKGSKITIKIKKNYQLEILL